MSGKKDEKGAIRVGFLGSGDIAHRVSGALKKLKGIQLYAAASRNKAHAQSLADEFGFRRVYGSYEELLSDPDVDLAYVGVPHPQHYELAKLCARYDKPLLLEKPFAINHYQAQEVIRIYEEKGLFLGEALWTRFLPGRRFIEDAVAQGLIGDIRMADVNMVCGNCVRERMTNPEMGGGALLDLGVYALNFVTMFLGTDIADMKSVSSKWTTGVDEQEAVLLSYPDGRIGVCKAGMNGADNWEGEIIGSNGRIHVSDVTCLSPITVMDASGRVLRRFDRGSGAWNADGTPDSTWNRAGTGNPGEERGTDSVWNRAGAGKPGESGTPDSAWNHSYSGASDPGLADAGSGIVGYEYEFLEAREALLRGRTEFAEMTHADTMFLMNRYDMLRHAWGIDYPCERGL